MANMLFIYSLLEWILNWSAVYYNWAQPLQQIVSTFFAFILHAHILNVEHAFILYKHKQTHCKLDCYFNMFKLLIQNNVK